MTDTVRNWSDIVELLADNSTQRVSTQDLRDALVTLAKKEEVVLTGDGTHGPFTVNGTTGFLANTTEVFVDGVRYSRATGAELKYSEASNGLTITFSSDIVAPNSGANIVVRFYAA